MNHDELTKAEVAGGTMVEGPFTLGPITEIEGPQGLELTLQQRGGRYGDYGRMATVAQRLKEAMGSRAHISAVERESLDQIATKIARIVCGEPLQRDSWHDIQGYAKLAEDRCPVPPVGAMP